MVRIEPFVFIFVLFGVYASAQPILPERDSLPITRPKPMKATYQMPHSSLRDISIVTKTPESVNALPKKFLGNVAGGLLTIFSGINTSSSEEAQWVMRNELTSTDAAKSWHVPLFFSGELTKERERTRNDDGSYSVETTKGVHVDWSKESYGLILEQGDTVGGFRLVTDFREDAASRDWHQVLGAEGVAATRALKFFNRGQGYNVKVEGVLRHRAFSMYTNGAYFRSVIFLEDKPVAVFQSDPDYMSVGKKSRLHPYLLTSPQADTDQTDLLRLAFLNALLARCLSTDFYEK